jgi:hypothetical protein
MTPWQTAPSHYLLYFLKRIGTPTWPATAAPKEEDKTMAWVDLWLCCQSSSYTQFVAFTVSLPSAQSWGNPRHQSSCRVRAFVRRHLQVTSQTEVIDVLTLRVILFVCFRTPCRWESQMKTLKVRKKFRTIARLSCKFNSDIDRLKSGRQVAARYYIEKWSHCVLFVFNKLRDKTYLRFSCE